jgi:hypothetical protein
VFRPFQQVFSVSLLDLNLANRCSSPRLVQVLHRSFVVEVPSRCNHSGDVLVQSDCLKYERVYCAPVLNAYCQSVFLLLSRQFMW